MAQSGRTGWCAVLSDNGRDTAGRIHLAFAHERRAARTGNHDPSSLPSRVTPGGKSILSWQPIVVRYADDFVVLHQDGDVIEQTRRIAAEWLTGMGLELKPEKTKIVHTLDRHDDQVGFDFLGFNVRQHRVGKHHTARSTNGEPLGFKAIISPSQDAQKRHAADMAAVLRRNLQAPQEAVIDQLNAK